MPARFHILPTSDGGDIFTSEMDATSQNEGKWSRSLLSNYRLGKTLGIGAFGKVKLGIHILTGERVAIKILHRESINDSSAEKVRREINMMRLVSHPHVVQLYEVIETHEAIYMVMEYMDSGELFDYITENGRLMENEARMYFQQIISGVESCHLHSVVHRDLKPENLLMDSKGILKIADFGLGNIMRDGHFLKTSCGSPNYAAPEVIFQKLYAGPEVDVWSCGVILYALLCGRLPFDDDNVPGLFAKIKNGIYTFPNYLSHGARDLIARILVVDPVNRITIPEIHQHDWFQRHLPRYISMRPIETLHGKSKINKDIIKDMALFGFAGCEVIESLNKKLQNKATVTYFLLLQKHHRECGNFYKEELFDNLPKELVDRPKIDASSVIPSHGKWAVGFKACSSPAETFREVLKIFESLNIRWKNIGLYNIKCLWLPPNLGYSMSTISAKCTPSENICAQVVPITSGIEGACSSSDAVKFVIQLYKDNRAFYVLDWHRISGPPMLFLEICAGFLTRAMV